VYCFRRTLCACACFGWLASSAAAHDTWVEANRQLLRPGDCVWIDLKLGNHGNQHRDFKLAGKIDLAACTLDVQGPDGSKHDLLPSLHDTGYAPNEGYWTGKFVPAQPGLYTVAHTLDKLHRTTRAIKSAKTCFAVSPSLDNVEPVTAEAVRPLGHPLELVPLSDLAVDCGPGREIAVQLLYRGQPLADTRVSFIPRGATLAEGFDENYERNTDGEGRASFTPTTSGWILIVAKRAEESERGEGFDRTSYSATLTVYVPELCPCCE
jgi:uncharacterized GH25 family protein